MLAFTATCTWCPCTTHCVLLSRQLAKAVDDLRALVNLSSSLMEGRDPSASLALGVKGQRSFPPPPHTHTCTHTHTHTHARTHTHTHNTHTHTHMHTHTHNTHTHTQWKALYNVMYMYLFSFFFVMTDHFQGYPPLSLSLCLSLISPP